MEHRRDDQTDEAEPLNPISLTLALWLGLIVGVTGVTRFVQHAANNAANTQALAAPSSLAPPADQDRAPTTFRAALGE